MTAFFAEFSYKGSEMWKILTKGGCQRAARGGKINTSYSNRRRPLHFLAPGGKTKEEPGPAETGGAAVWRPAVRRCGFAGRETVPCGGRTVTVCAYGRGHSEKPQEGVVVAVGAGKVYDNGQRVAPEVKVGDTVMFAKYAGSELEIDGATHLIISERDILAVL